MSDEQTPDGAGRGIDEMGVGGLGGDENSTFEADLEAGQPKGLWVLFITEMWERFSYYGMRALFVLFLIASADIFLPAADTLDTPETTRAAIVEMLSEQTGTPESEITAATTLSGDLGLDADKKAALLTSLETLFDVDYPDDPATLDDVQTVEQLTAFAQSDATQRPNKNPGFGWTDKKAYGLYGTYTFMVYLTSIFGGIAADRLLGTHRSMLIGGWIIAMGHIVLAGMALFPHELGTAVSQSHGYPALLSFLIGCTLIIIGTGFFKPCVSVMVGQLYHQNDPRRDSGFTIFYMGINLGGFLAPIVAGSLAKFVGWHWGFGAAAVGMLVGLFFYQAIRHKYLEGIGMPPEEGPKGKAKGLVVGALALLVAIPLVPLALFVSGSLSTITGAWGGFTTWVATQTRDVLGAFGFASKESITQPVIDIVAEQTGVPADQITTSSSLAGDLALTADQKVTLLDTMEKKLSGPFPDDAGALDAVSSVDQLIDFATQFAAIDTARVYGMAVLITAIVVAASLIFLLGQKRRERGPLAVILILAFIGNIFFWTAFEQAGSSMNVFAEKNTDRSLWGIFSGDGFPAEYYQSVNSLTILLFAPFFSWLWLFLERKKKDPSTPLKFSIGLWLLGLSFIAMVGGSLESQAAADGLAGPYWLLITYVVYTWGELCLSPVGLSMVSKLAPQRLQSLMMGLWFFSFALSNLLAALVAQFSTSFKPDEETGAPADASFLGVEGLAGFYLMLVVFPIAAGFLIFAISPWIKKMMGGVR